MNTPDLISDKAWKTILGHSLLAGFFPAIPVPWLDEEIADNLEQRMYARLFAQQGLTLDEDGQKLLQERPSSLFGGVLRTAILFPIKRVARKAIIALTLKRCADVIATSIHDGWMVARMLEAGYVDKELLRDGDTKELRRMRSAILTARENVSLGTLRLLYRSAVAGAAELSESVGGKLTSGESRPGTWLRERAATSWSYLGDVDQVLRDSLGVEGLSDYTIEDKKSSKGRKGAKGANGSTPAHAH